MFAILIVCAGAHWGQAQPHDYLPYDADLYQDLSALSIRVGRGQAHPVGLTAPLARPEVARLADSALYGTGHEGGPRTLSRPMTRVARFWVDDDPMAWPDSLVAGRGLAGGRLYRYRASLAAYRSPELDIQVSPVFSGMLGRAPGDSVAGGYYINTRGVEVRGTVDGRVSFYTMLADNQVALPGYVTDYAQYPNGQTPRFPQESFIKRIAGTGALPPLNDPSRPQGYDFITARAHVAFRATRHIGVALGQDRLFIGDGIRSLVLSGEQAPSMPFLRLDTRVWRLRLTNLYAQLKAGGRIPGDRLIPNKYLAYHNLEMDITPTLKVSVYESVVFAPPDSARRSSYALAYLNPLIFYRFAEQHEGSADNSLVGATIRWDLFRQVRLYGGLLFDELKVSNLRAQNGWWGNKYALQAGAHLAEPLGIPGLSVQIEGNAIRPFTYTHRNRSLDYTHLNVPLAHPMGANLIEAVGRARWQIAPGLWLRGQGMYVVQGVDSVGGRNFGGDVLRSYDQGRRGEFGYRIGDGRRSRTALIDGGVQWSPWHRVFVDLGATVRRQTLEGETAQRRLTFVYLNVRWNFHRRDFLF